MPWLQNGTLKRETESLMFAAQEQAIQTDVFQGRINKSQEQTKCRMCSRADETINHIVRECPKPAHRAYKKTYDWIGSCIHWKIYGANGIYVKSKGYKHQLESVIENDSCKTLWDFAVQTDHF